MAFSKYTRLPIDCEQAGQLLCLFFVVFHAHGSAVLPVAAAALSGTPPSLRSPSMTPSSFNQFNNNLVYNFIFTIES